MYVCMYWEPNICSLGQITVLQPPTSGIYIHAFKEIFTEKRREGQRERTETDKERTNIETGRAKWKREETNRKEVMDKGETDELKLKGRREGQEKRRDIPIDERNDHIHLRSHTVHTFLSSLQPECRKIFLFIFLCSWSSSKPFYLYIYKILFCS